MTIQKGDSAIMAQMKKLFKHTRSGSYASRKRYENACKTFITFLNECYGMKNLRNLQDKHIVAYIEYRQELGIAHKTIKTDLGAIRFMHDMIPNAKYKLSTNAQLQKIHDIVLDKTLAVHGDRAWTEKEYNDMLHLLNIQAATNKTAAITRDVMILARTMGLRVAEAVCMRRSQAERALRTGIYTVQNEAKNGRYRDVPLSNEARLLLNECLENVERGGRLFISPNRKAHEVVNSIEQHLAYYRDSITTLEGMDNRIDIKYKINPLTFHGLRYNYVQQRMHEEQVKGLSWEKAANIVTKEVGHGRSEVIKIYTNNNMF